MKPMFVCLLMTGILPNDFLSQHVWKDRVIVAIANGDQKDLEQQLANVLESWDEIEDRDLVVYHNSTAFREQEKLLFLSNDQIEWLREDLGTEKKSVYLLIGKDGGVKLKKEEPIELSSLFSLIDGMPMRRAEMRRKGN